MANIEKFAIVKAGRHGVRAVPMQEGTTRFSAVQTDRATVRFGGIPDFIGPRERKTSYRALPPPMNGR
jgi:hypothetical protein